MDVLLEVNALFPYLLFMLLNGHLIFGDNYKVSFHFNFVFEIFEFHLQVAQLVVQLYHLLLHVLLFFFLIPSKTFDV